MRLLRLVLVGTAVAASSPSAGALPPEAVAYLSLFPEKALTLDLVVGQAVKASDSYRGLRSLLDAAEAPGLAGKAGLDTRLSARADWLDDRNAPPNPFQPARTQSTTVGLALVTPLRTGTDITLDLSHGYRKLDFAATSLVTLAPYFETRGTVGLTQHLWRNSFGYSTRAGVNAAKAASESLKANYEMQREAWFGQLSDIYYQAWFAQTLEKASRKTLERQDRLLRTVELKVKRGTSEEPDRLQVQAARTQSEIQLYKDKQSLGDLWRNLVTVLKLPVEWMQIDPSDIPMNLDSPVPSALTACEGPKEATPESNATVAQAESAFVAAQFEASRAKSNFNPSLDLNLSFAANGVNGLGSTAISDFSSLAFPRYNANLVFTLPLGFYAERAAAAEAVSKELRAEADFIQAKDLARNGWTNGCLDLKRLHRSNAWLVTTLRDQRKREALEEERFQLGRSGTLQVIQAGGDASQAEVALAMNEISMRSAAWKILKLSGRVREYLNQLEKTEKP